MGARSMSREVRAREQRERLDVALVARGLATSREKATRLIMAGSVKVDGKRADKAGILVGPRSELEVLGQPRFVSRGGDKLAHALSAFGVDVAGMVCLDTGASRGGFTHCLLDHGAARVYAVDVGHGQLDAKLRADGRVIVMEKVNARHLDPRAFPEAPTLGVVDVSFISLEKVLPSVVRVLAPTGRVLALVKPQFEVGRGQVGKGGVVRDPTSHREVLRRLARFCVLRGWHVIGVTPSPLTGPKGNREFFLHITLRGRTASDLDAQLARAAEAAPA